MTFRVGQKVVCVDASNTGGKLSENEIYTVAVVDTAPISRSQTLWPAELGPRPRDGGWYARRFRPIVERKTDISIFTAMLNPSKQEIDA